MNNNGSFQKKYSWTYSNKNVKDSVAKNERIQLIRQKLLKKKFNKP